MNGVIERVAELIKELGLTPNAFAKEVGLGSSNLSRKLKGSTPFTVKDFVKICDSIGVNREWLETGEGEKRTYSLGFDKDSLNRSIDKAFTQCAHGDDAKPFYDVDFVLGLVRCITTLLTYQLNTSLFLVMRRRISGAEHQVTA